ANKLYDLRLEYFDGTRTAAITLFWDTPTREQERIPSTRFFAYNTRSGNIGDFGWDNDYEAGVVRMIKGWNPDFISTVGDNNYPHGSSSTIDQNIGQYFHQYVANYKGSYGSGASTNRFFPALGNHDWETSNTAAYKSYFTLPGNERYYDFIKGSIHFFIVDSDNHEPDGNSPG